MMPLITPCPLPTIEDENPAQPLAELTPKCVAAGCRHLGLIGDNYLPNGCILMTVAAFDPARPLGESTV